MTSLILPRESPINAGGFFVFDDLTGFRIRWPNQHKGGRFAIRIGNPQSWDLAWAAVRESGGWVDELTDDEILHAQKLLAEREGVFCEPASAISVGGLLRDIKAGKVKVYGVTTKNRVAALKDIPTLDEQGLKGFEVGVWHAVYAPKKTPKPVMDTLVSTMQQALKDPALIGTLAQLGTEPVPQNQATPAYLESFLKAEIDKWTPIIKAAGPM